MNANTLLRLKNWLLPLAAIGLLLVIIAWMAGAFRDKIEPGLAAPAAGDAPAGTVVQSEDIVVTEPVPASIGARQATTISSRTLARITQIHVRAGDSIAEGQLLIELERSDLESRLLQASEQVRGIEARLYEAQQSLERAEELYAQRLVAAAALDEARAQQGALSADLATARQAVKEAEVALGYTEIRSPIDGRVVERFAEPGDTTTPGDKLLTLYNPFSMRIEAPVREGLALSLELGQVLEVDIAATGERIQATIEELVPAADPGSRSFMVKARIDSGRQLMPGMYARILVPAGQRQALLVPSRYVVHYGQLDLVWVASDGDVERRFIRTGREVKPGLVEVLAGLEDGERVLDPDLR